MMSAGAKIGVIHTSPATVDLFGRLLRERLPGAVVLNLLDDSILPELRENGGDLSAVEPHFRDYARIVSDQGVDLILNACSSIGTLCDRVRPTIPQPIVRVNAAMAQAVARRGRRIGILATVATTLAPAADLIQETAWDLGWTVTVDAELIEGAYAALINGDQARHDALVRRRWPAPRRATRSWSWLKPLRPESRSASTPRRARRSSPVRPSRSRTSRGGSVTPDERPSGHSPPGSATLDRDAGTAHRYLDLRSPLSPCPGLATVRRSWPSS